MIVQSHEGGWSPLFEVRGRPVQGLTYHQREGLTRGLMKHNGIEVIQARRNREFDLMRLAFATFVILSHSPELIDGNRSRELLTRLTGAMSFGDLGVDGFFLMSGYLIVQSFVHDPELWNFLRKRVLRIYPGYLVACVLVTIVLGSLIPAEPGFFRALNYHTVTAMAKLGMPPTPLVRLGSKVAGEDGSLWTIAYEFRCYLMVAFLGVAGLLRRKTVWVGLTVLFFAAYVSPWVSRHLFWHRGYFYTGEPEQTFRLASAFFVGGCFFLLKERIKFLPIYAGCAFAVLVAVRFTSSYLFQPAMMLAGGYLLFYLGQMKLHWVDRLPKFPDISYGVYLYGWPVELLWIDYMHGSPWTTFLAVSVISYGLGWLSWHFVERPMLKLKKRTTATLPAG
jgi:peptidoglycan/LPS O-acetylase OafA/YrhL